MSLSNAANRIARQQEMSLDLPAGSESNPPFATTGDMSSQRLQGIVPRRSQRSIRHGTNGSLSSISSGGGAMSVESSIDAFAEDLLSLATQGLETSVPRTSSTSSTTSRNIDVAGLTREVSNKTIDEHVSTNPTNEEHPLIIGRVQSRLIAKHIQSGRLTAISSCIDIRDGRSRDHLADAGCVLRSPSGPTLPRTPTRVQGHPPFPLQCAATTHGSLSVVLLRKEALPRLTTD